MVSTQPLSDPMTEEPDKSLYGHWVSVTNSGTQYHVYIGESGKTAGDVSKPFMEGLLFSWKSDGSTKKINPMYSGYLTVSRIGSSSYINVYATPDMEGKRIEAHTSSDNWRYETWLRNPDKLVGIFRYVVQENRVTFGMPLIANRFNKISSRGQNSLQCQETNFSQISNHQTHQ